MTSDPRQVQLQAGARLVTDFSAGSESGAAVVNATLISNGTVTAQQSTSLTLGTLYCQGNCSLVSSLGATLSFESHLPAQTDDGSVYTVHAYVSDPDPSAGGSSSEVASAQVMSLSQSLWVHASRVKSVHRSCASSQPTKSQLHLRPSIATRKTNSEPTNTHKLIKTKTVLSSP